MLFDYTTSLEVKVTMYQYSDGILDNVPDAYWKGIGTATPAPDSLYNVRDGESEECKLLPDGERE